MTTAAQTQAAAVPALRAPRSSGISAGADIAPALIPAEAFFLVSAVFHYLGPSFAVLLFARVEVLGVAWLRIASAAVIFALCRRPWRRFGSLPFERRRLIVAWGAVIAVMNCCFYLAISRLHLGTVAAIEFVPVIFLAAIGTRTRRNAVSIALAVAGVWLLTSVVLAGEPLGVAFALANAVLFGAYVTLGHRVARFGADAGVDALAAGILVAALVVTPIAGPAALPEIGDPIAILAGVGVGITSSVVPYVTDQLAMARLKRSTYALLTSLLPATATIVGLLVLRQVPSLQDMTGVGLVVLAVALHSKADAR